MQQSNVVAISLKDESKKKRGGATTIAFPQPRKKQVIPKTLKMVLTPENKSGSKGECLGPEKGAAQTLYQCTIVLYGKRGTIHWDGCLLV